ncbi:EthD family reductase [Acidiphilium sp.]|uniref:EthD family reductase n=1 Tax=Acidiphilium sp. TaxID=527 RepID=UPI003D054B17
MIAITVLYPKTDVSTFDTDYYHANHMKMVQDLWGPMGLHSARVFHGTNGPDGSAPSFAVIAVLEFESMAAFGAAAAAHGGPIMGDIKNFTNVQPILQFNEIAA